MAAEYPIHTIGEVCYVTSFKGGATRTRCALLNVEEHRSWTPFVGKP